MNRRRFFKFGAAGLLLAGGFGWLGKEFARQTVIPGQSIVESQHLPMMRALAAALLDGQVQSTDTAALEQAVAQFSASASALPLGVQAELGQLLNILENPVGRRLIANLGASWEDATVEQVQSFLLAFRDHPIPALQPGYHALHDLMMAAWYSQPQTWPAMGYAGPPFELA